MIEILAHNTDTGELAHHTLNPDQHEYVVINSGRRYLDSWTDYYSTGTVVLTLRVAKPETEEPAPARKAGPPDATA